MYLLCLFIVVVLMERESVRAYMLVQVPFTSRRHRRGYDRAGARELILGVDEALRSHTRPLRREARERHSPSSTYR